MPGLAAKIAAVLETRTRPLGQAQDKPALHKDGRRAVGTLNVRTFERWEAESRSLPTGVGTRKVRSSPPFATIATSLSAVSR